MLSTLLPVRSLLLAIFMIMAGGGFLSTLISIRLEQAGAGALMIGLVATAYFAGLTIGAMRAAPLIAKVGHIRAFAGFVSIFSASSLAYAVHRDVALWTMLRLVDGFAISGVFICLESWLNERAGRNSRSTILASYMMALYLGQALGQFLLNLGGAGSALPFMVAAILLSLALVPVVLTQIAQPTIDNFTPLSLRRLYAISPLGLVGVVLTGAMLGAFYGFGAVYARRLELDLSATAWFMSFAIMGGVLLQAPLGKLSDHVDRRKVIVASFSATTVICVVLAFAAAPGPLLFLLGSLFGGVSFALYPLCVAHTNDHISASERVGASGGLVLGYSLGAVAGPALGSVAMATFGTAGLFVFIGSCALCGTLFGLWRLWAGSAVPDDEQFPYEAMPRTTPMVAAIDSEPDQR